MSVENPENNEKRKPNVGEKITAKLFQYSVAAVSLMVYGREGMEIMRGAVLGISEDGILGSPLAFPSDEGEHLNLRTAHAGQWLSYDFRRGEFYPAAKKKLRMYSEYSEGILTAFTDEGIDDRPIDERRELSFSEMLDVDRLLSHDKPGIGKLLEIGIVELRTQEDAYEQAGATRYIDELRAKNLAQDKVYQVTPKGHGAVMLVEEDGKPTPPRLDPVKLRGVRIAHSS